MTGGGWVGHCSPFRSAVLPPPLTKEDLGSPWSPDSSLPAWTGQSLLGLPTGVWRGKMR